MTARRVPRWSEVRPLLRRGVRRSTPPIAGWLGRRPSPTCACCRAPRAVFDYTDGAAGDELALRRSREAYERVEFSPHVLEDVSSVDTSTVILGRPAAAPFGFAPTSFTRMMHTRRRASRRARRRTDRHPVCVISDRHDVDRRPSCSCTGRTAVVPALSLARPRGEPRLRGPGRSRRL